MFTLTTTSVTNVIIHFRYKSFVGFWKRILSNSVKKLEHQNQPENKVLRLYSKLISNLFRVSNLLSIVVETEESLQQSHMSSHLHIKSVRRHFLQLNFLIKIHFSGVQDFWHKWLNKNNWPFFPEEKKKLQVRLISTPEILVSTRLFNLFQRRYLWNLNFSKIQDFVIQWVVIMVACRRGHPVYGGAFPVPEVPTVQEVPEVTPAP